MDCDYTSCVWNDSYKGCIKPKGRACPRPILEQIKKQQTNADRIRAMSDEELVDFLGEYRFCDICDEGCEACTYHGDCDKRLLDWLKQPAG